MIKVKSRSAPNSTKSFRTVGSTDHDQEQAGSVNNWTCAGIDPQD